jgi:hypothetical protein
VITSKMVMFGDQDELGGLLHFAMILWVINLKVRLANLHIPDGRGMERC